MYGCKHRNHKVTVYWYRISYEHYTVQTVPVDDAFQLQTQSERKYFLQLQLTVYKIQNIILFEDI